MGIMTLHEADDIPETSSQLDLQHAAYRKIT